MVDQPLEMKGAENYAFRRSEETAPTPHANGVLRDRGRLGGFYRLFQPTCWGMSPKAVRILSRNTFGSTGLSSQMSTGR